MNIGIPSLIKKSVLAVTLSFTFLMITSCPNPLKTIMLRQVQDETAPEITLELPSDGDAYGAYTRITGVVTDSSDGDTDGYVSSLTVEILGVTGNRNISVDEDGSFSTVLETSGAGFSGDIVLKIIATDWNGNETNLSLALEKSEGAIADFQVLAGNRSAQISWSPVPGASGYTIQEYYTGEKFVVESVNSYVWEGLTNGNLYEFSLMTEIEGEILYSSFAETIPLSEMTLFPKTNSVYREVELSWNAIPAASRYIIERSENLGGPYVIQGLTADSHYVDSELPKGEGYYYRVYPLESRNEPLLIKSVAEYGQSSYFPEIPEDSEVASFNTLGNAHDVCVIGNYAYLADGDAGLRIINISDPLAPIQTGSVGTGNAVGISIAGDYAYVANESSGLKIVNISDPYHPYITGSFGVYALDVDVSDDYAYVAGANIGLRIIDISDSSNPVDAGTLWTGNAVEVAVSGDYVYVANGTYGFMTIDISTPSSPFETREIDIAGWTANGVTVNGNYAYVAYNIGLQVYDLTNPDNPATAGFYNITPGSSERVTVQGNYAYIANAIGIRIIDVSDPYNILDSRMINTPGMSSGIAVSDDYAYVADYDEGLTILDISMPSTLSKVGTFNTNVIRGVTVSGKYAFVAEDIDDMSIIDISNPSSPVETAHFPANGSTKRIFVSGNYAYMAAGTTGLIIVDISDPFYPIEVSCFDTSEQVLDVVVVGHYAYIADYYNGIGIIDISDPANPFEVGYYDTNRALKLAVSGEHVYVANDTNLVVIDVSNPEIPIEVDSVFVEAEGIAIGGNHAYLASDTTGMKVFDISDPTNINEVGSFDAGRCLDIVVLGDYVYVTDILNGIRVIDVTSPDSPYEIGFFETESSAQAIDVFGKYAYVADFTNGLHIVDMFPEM